MKSLTWRLVLCWLAVVVLALPRAAVAADQGGSNKTVAPSAPVEGKISGVAIPRANGTWLGLSVENDVFRLGFYDARKMPMAPDVTRAVARWHVKTKLYQDSSVLEPAPDGVSLVGNQFVRPPRVFKVFLSLMGEDDKVLESYVVDFNG